MFIHADTNPPMNIPSVRMDDYLAGQSAGEYLIKHGHEKIAGIFKSDDMQGQLRYSGAINALKNIIYCNQKKYVLVYNRRYQTYYEW